MCNFGKGTIMMNILYISKLDGAPWSGPSYSIPMQINSQAEYDNIMWYNLTDDKFKTFTKEKNYNDIINYPVKTIKNLPSPFNNPDLVIFEQFYAFTVERIVHEVQLRDIPYIIVPRGEMNREAQRRKRVKKTIANMLIMAQFVRNAVGIQFLTASELDSSVNFKVKRKFIIPNGVAIKNHIQVSKEKKKDRVDVVYIGRLDLYHKGLDLLIKATNKVKLFMREKRCSISIYGPDRTDCVEKLQGMIREYSISDIISIQDGLYGEKKEEVLISSDVFIMTSRFEGLPMGLIEALSYGLPAIITKGTNMAKEIEENGAGWGCGTDINSIAKGIIRMLEELDNMDQYRINAKKMAELYSWERIAASSHELYTDMVKE